MKKIRTMKQLNEHYKDRYSFRFTKVYDFSTFNYYRRISMSELTKEGWRNDVKVFGTIAQAIEYIEDL